MRHWAPLLLALAIAACSSEPNDVSARFGQFALETVLPEGLFGDETAPAPQPTRAELDRIPSAMIALSNAIGPRAFVVPLADNGGYVTYLDANRRGVVLQGGAIVGTLSYGIALNGVRNAASDPIAYPRPLAEWPGEVRRAYEYRQRDGADYIVALTCTYERGVRERIEIVERSYTVTRIAETCANRARNVVNTYWVADDGFIWKSRQWVAPKTEPLTLEVIRPYQPASK